MKHIAKVLIICLIILCLISGCAKENKNFVVVNEGNNTPATQSPTQEPTIVENQIDPLAEEFPGDIIPEEENINPNSYTNTQSNYINEYEFPDSTEYPYAGSTPIAIMPADLPTPTPKKALEFTYQEYTANNLNLKFEAPSGWEINESIQDTFILNEPAANQRDGYSASITVRAIPVAKDYSNSDLIRELKQQLEQLGATNYERWSPSLTATRELLGADGIYANYSGTLVTGVKVRGRIHVVCVNKVLYTVHFSQPSSYNNDYITAYTNLRRTIKFLNK